MKLNCLIVEDEPIAQEILRSYIDKTGFLHVAGQMNNAIDALEFLKRHPVDLLFLDIKMPQMTGLELLKSLPHKPKVVITSAYRYYATDAFELDVVDYLLKPYPFERFLKAIGKVSNEMSEFPDAEKNREKPFIFVKGNKQLYKISIDDILYLESQRDYLKFTLLNQQEVVTRQTIAYYQEFLPASLFVRVHRSFMVAINKISVVEANHLKVGPFDVPVGRNFKQQVQEAIKSIIA
jgi:DNA-binding LytR/AlgR family response regulator